MDIVGQIMSLLKISARAAFTLFAACALCLVAYHFRSDLFEGLPGWVMPLLRLSFLFTFVLWIIPASAAAVAALLRACRRILRAALAGWRRRRLQRTILSSPLTAKYAILFALAHRSQRLRAIQSDPTTLRMLDDGLLKRTSWAGSTQFLIPDEVWRAALEIEGFFPESPRNMLQPWYDEIPMKRMLFHIPKKFH